MEKERTKVEKCYKCDPDTERSIEDFIEWCGYRCECGHLFTVRDPKKVIYVDGKMNNHYNQIRK